MWIVTRQNYSSLGENANVVEICGARTHQYPITDYPNPGALVAKYDGEFEEFDSPYTAANAAVSIYKQWKADGGKNITIRHGFTGGNSTPFDAPEHGAGIKEAIKWGEQLYATLPKCPVCNGIMPEEKKQWFLTDMPDEKVCSENCCNKLQEENEKFQAELAAENAEKFAPGQEPT